MDIATVAPDRFRTAALGLIPWEVPLGEVCDALDCSLAQIAGLDRHDNLAFNVLTAANGVTVPRGSRGSTGSMLADYMAANGHLPEANPRTQAHQRAVPGRCFVDDDFISPAGAAQHSIYRGLFRDYDASQTAMIRLPTPGGTDGLRTGLSLFWPERRGPATPATRKLLETVAPAIGSAAILAMQIDGRRDATLVDTVEHLRGPTFLLTAQRLVLAVSPSAERFLRSAGDLTVRNGKLSAPSFEGTARLVDACARALDPAPGAAGAVTLALPRSDRAPVWIADITRLPLRDPSGLTRGTLFVTLRRATGAPPPGEASLVVAFGLTVAEAAVAALVADGHDPATIAARRGVSAGTVRTQLKAIFGKTETRRQIELSLALAPYRAVNNDCLD